MDYLNQGGQSAVPLNRFGRFLHGVFWAVFVLLCGFTLWGSLSLVPQALLFFVLAVPVFALLAFFAYRYQGPRFLLYLLIIALIARIIGVLILHPTPDSDFLTQYNAAVSITHGNFSFNRANYFTTYPYQVGFSVYQAILLRLINSIWWLRLVNVVLSTASVWLVYALAQKLTASRFTAQFAGMVYALFATPIAYNGVLTNNIPGTFLTLLSLYLVVQAEKRSLGWLWILLGGLLLSLSNFLRPDGLALFVAIAAYFVFGLFTPQWRTKLLHIAIIAVAYLGCNAALSGVVKTTGLSPLGMAVQNSYWKFSVGLDMSNNGAYSPRVVARTDMLTKKKHLSQTAASKQITFENLRTLRRAGIGPVTRMAISKQNIFWFGQGGLLFPLADLKQSHPRWADWLNQLNTAWILWVFIFSLLALYPLWRSGYSPQLLLVFFVFTFTLVNLLTEVQYRYSFSVQPMLFIMAGIGLEWVLGKGHRTV